MTKEEQIYLIGLNHFGRFGPVSFSKLYLHYHSWQKIFASSPAAWPELGLNKKIADDFAVWRNNFSFDRALNFLAQQKISWLTLDDDDYPPLLKQISQPPLLLYYRGSPACLQQTCLAVVGSRNVDDYGQHVTEKLLGGLSGAFVTIVSGLALGIDTLAHRAALQNKLATAAVLGTGLDEYTLYPADNRRLADEIINNNGCLLSEFAPLTPGFKNNFPQRNRLISGLSTGVLIVEAAEKSGSLITARHGLEQNREVMAVPGNIFSPLCTGTNNLIATGARPILGADDLLEALNLQADNGPSQAQHLVDLQNLSEVEQKIMAKLGSEPIAIDQLAQMLQFDISEINSILTMMEINGLVKSTGASSYRRA